MQSKGNAACSSREDTKNAVSRRARAGGGAGVSSEGARPACSPMRGLIWKGSPACIGRATPLAPHKKHLAPRGGARGGSPRVRKGQEKARLILAKKHKSAYNRGRKSWKGRASCVGRAKSACFSFPAKRNNRAENAGRHLGRVEPLAFSFFLSHVYTTVTKNAHQRARVNKHAKTKPCQPTQQKLVLPSFRRDSIVAKARRTLRSGGTNT